MKKFLSIVFTLAICFSSVIFVSAKTNDYIVDQDNVLSQQEFSEIENRAEAIENKYGYAIIFCIVTDTNGKSVTEYCEDEYKKLTDSPDGLIVTHNITTSKYSYYCAGNAKSVFNDAIFNTVWKIYDTNEIYYTGLLGFYVAAEEILKPTITSSAPDSPVISQGEDATDFVKVERTLPLVVDKAGLLSASDENNLSKKLDDFVKEYKIELSILTVNDLGDKTPQEYADDFFDYNGYGYGENKDGMLVLFKPGIEGERELYISTHGSAIDEIGDSYNSILDAMIDDLIAENYLAAFDTYIEKSGNIINPSATPVGFVICIAAGFFLSFIIIKAMTSGNRSVRKKVDAAGYSRPGSMVVTGSMDNFVDRHVTRVAKPKESTSSHTSSSGESHGGGGRSF